MTPITMLIKTLNLHTIKLMLIPILLSIPNLTQEIFVEVYFYGLVILCVLQELIFATRNNWFFLLGINFCNFKEVPTLRAEASVFAV